MQKCAEGREAAFLQQHSSGHVEQAKPKAHKNDHCWKNTGVYTTIGYVSLAEPHECKPSTYAQTGNDTHKHE